MRRQHGTVPVVDTSSGSADLPAGEKAVKNLNLRLKPSRTSDFVCTSSLPEEQADQFIREKSGWICAINLRPNLSRCRRR